MADLKRSAAERDLKITWSFANARTVGQGERDHALDIEATSWPPLPAPAGWRRRPGYLYRYVENGPIVGAAHGESRREDHEVAEPLRESILRFPSAPIRCVERRHEYHDSPARPLSMHTLRVLTARKPPKRIDRIFLFHNGLNELERTGLYYQLASQIIASAPVDPKTGEKEGVACILRPFPGHLTRARYARFAEEPLQRYLWDGSHLFNQFLRYMTETQWFLSAIVKRSSYRCPSGAELLAERPTPPRSRLDAETLVKAIEDAWSDLSEASCRSRAGAQSRDEPFETRPPEAPPADGATAASVKALRSVLALDAWRDLGGTRASTPGGGPEEPTLHVVGYSLGGFTAQSVFMSWPFVISSCSTLLSGGALRELSPTAFAHQEEWQTVLHSLRYELDEGMLDGRYVVSRGEVAGLRREFFHYLQRTFYEVFQQEYRGGYASRVKAFMPRMLFVLGGDDPIVRADSVLASAPAGGMNVVEIGGLGHFLSNDPKGSEERSQREFWLPEVAELIGRFSIDVAKRHLGERPRTWLTGDIEVPRKPAGVDSQELRRRHGVRRLSDRERLEIPGDGALSNRLFGLCLNDLLARQRPRRDGRANPGSGLLLGVRNEIPTLLLEARAVQRRARAIYHDDDHIAKYCRDIYARAEAFRAGVTQATLVMPWNAMRLMEHLDPPHRFPSQSETAVGHLRRELGPRATWEACEKTLTGFAEQVPGSVLVFDGRRELTSDEDLDLSFRALLDQQRRRTGSLMVPSLPDCWIYMHAAFLDLTTWNKGQTVIDARARFVSQVRSLFAQDAGTREEAETRLAEHLQAERVRVLTVSRARYNPRFRGKLVLDPHTVKQVMLHAALCVSGAHDYLDFDMESGDSRLKPTSP